MPPFRRLGSAIGTGIATMLAFASVCNAAPCEPLPPPSGNVRIVAPSEVGSLHTILNSAVPGDSILLEDGTYPLTNPLVIRTSGVTLRSRSGSRSAVILDAAYNGGIREALNIVASNVTVADLTVMRALDHPIHVQAPNGTITGTKIYNVRVIDPGQQAIKINTGAGGFTDNGTIACSYIELTDAGRSHVRDSCYTGGIDAHQSQGWVIRDNVVAGFWCADGLSEHGIHLWTGSRDTIVERNYLLNNARGIGFGLGLQTSGRTYSDLPCAGRTNVGHYGGTIRNNFVFANDTRLFGTPAGVDVGIGLEDTCGSKILHNTIFTTQAPFSSIEWRFERNDGKTVPRTIIANNLASHTLRARDGAQADTMGNAVASASLFVDAAHGDLHLVEGASVINQGAPIGVADDFDGQTRDAAPDLGADERSSSQPPPNPPPDGGGGGSGGGGDGAGGNGDGTPQSPLTITVSPDAPTVSIQSIRGKRKSYQVAEIILDVGVASPTLSPRKKVKLRVSLAGVPADSKASVRLRRRSLRPGASTTVTVRVKGRVLPPLAQLVLTVTASGGGLSASDLSVITITE